MKLQVIVHEAEEGGYWAEAPAIPDCATQGETFEELLQNLHEAAEGCLAVAQKLDRSWKTVFASVMVIANRPQSV
jgi:predicted RNase H-like HicB family nuclease